MSFFDRQIDINSSMPFIEWDRGFSTKKSHPALATARQEET
jgi:hypothetical protein